VNDLIGATDGASSLSLICFCREDGDPIGNPNPETVNLNLNYSAQLIT
jgi:hypothetical protein